MLSEKASLVEGRALLLLKNYPAAAAKLQAAARGFRTHGAWWYTAEAMLLIGEAYIADGKIAEAASVFLAGLQVTVDDLQRARFLESIRRQSEVLDAGRVCSCIAVLLKQNRELADAVKRTSGRSRSCAT